MFVGETAATHPAGPSLLRIRAKPTCHHPSLFAAWPLADRHRSETDGGMARQRGFDLAGFHSKAAYFYLFIHAPKEIQVAIFKPADRIARPVEPEIEVLLPPVVRRCEGICARTVRR